jgi:hypothetical protein
MRNRASIPDTVMEIFPIIATAKYAAAAFLALPGLAMVGYSARQMYRIVAQFESFKR